MDVDQKLAHFLLIVFVCSVLIGYFASSRAFGAKCEAAGGTMLVSRNMVGWPERHCIKTIINLQE